MNKLIKNIYWGLLYFYCCSLFTMELSTERATDEFIKKIYDLKFGGAIPVQDNEEKVFPMKAHQEKLLPFAENFLELDQKVQNNILDNVTNMAYFYAIVGYVSIKDNSSNKSQSQDRWIKKLKSILEPSELTQKAINKYYPSFEEKIKDNTTPKDLQSIKLFLNDIKTITKNIYSFSHDMTELLKKEVSRHLYPYLILNFVLLPKDFQRKIIIKNVHAIYERMDNAEALFAFIKTIKLTPKYQKLMPMRKSLKVMEDLTGTKDDQILRTLGICLDNDADIISVVNFIKNFFVKTVRQIQEDCNALNKSLQNIINNNEYLSPILTFACSTDEDLEKIIFLPKDRERIKTCKGDPTPYISNHLQTKNLYELFTQAYTVYTIIKLKEPIFPKYRKINPLKIPTKDLEPNAREKINLLKTAQFSYLTKEELKTLNEIINSFPEIEKERLWKDFFVKFYHSYLGNTDYRPKFEYREGIIPIQEKLINTGTDILNHRRMFSEVFFLVLLTFIDFSYLAFSTYHFSFLAFSTYFFDNFIIHTTLSLLITSLLFIITERQASYRWKTHPIDYTKGETIEQFLSDKYEIKNKQ